MRPPTPLIVIDPDCQSCGRPSQITLDGKALCVSCFLENLNRDRALATRLRTRARPSLRSRTRT